MRGAILTAAVAAVFAVGCQRGTDAQDVQSERAELIEERQDLRETRAQEQQALQQDIQELRQEAQQEIQEERQELIEQRQELAETREEFQQQPPQEQEAFGGAAEAGLPMVSGTIESKKADQLTLSTQQGQQQLLVVTPETEFTWMGKEVKITDIPEGTQVRASYEMKGQVQVADTVEVLTQPGQTR